MLYNENVKQSVTNCLSFMSRVSTKEFDTVFRPSWGITVLGFLPFVGNITNFGCAVHAYKHGETWQGHQKLAEAIVGTSVDLATVGSTGSGLKLAQAGITGSNVGLVVAGSQILAKDVALRTATRVGAFGILHYVMNPFYKEYK